MSDNNQSLAVKENGNQSLTVKNLFSRDEVKHKFQELLGKKATPFITSVLQIVSQNNLLSKADPYSVYHSAAVAAILDLPLNPNLGFAYIVPYNQKYVKSDGSTGWKQVAQFQMGYKGFKQLALRSGQFIRMNSTDVREGEIVKHNRLTGEIEFAWIENYEERVQKKIVGYVSYFELLNGFSQTFYMTIDELRAHGKKYSQTFKKDFGLWVDNFESMCLKTVSKLNLSKNAPLSVEMQKAVVVDQSVINDHEALDVTYTDNEEPATQVDKEKERIRIMINEAQTVEQLEKISEHVDADQTELFDQKKEELKAKKNGKN
jgi:recombination protein RecT